MPPRPPDAGDRAIARAKGSPLRSAHGSGTAAATLCATLTDVSEQDGRVALDVAMLEQATSPA